MSEDPKSDPDAVLEPTPAEEPPDINLPVDEGTVCDVCGRRGRAEGHH